MVEILQFPKYTSFDERDLHVMGQAFEAAKAELSSPTPAELETLAERIIAAARWGERDAVVISTQALIEFRSLREPRIRQTSP